MLRGRRGLRGRGGEEKRRRERLRNSIYGIHQKVCGAMCGIFLPPCAPHFDGRAAVHYFVKRRNPWTASLFVEMPKCGMFGKIAAGLAKSAAIPYPALPAQIQRQTIKVWHIVLSDCGTQIFTNCCILF